MLIAIASDHRGFDAKRKLMPVLKQLGHEVRDFGCDDGSMCDYADFAAPAARAVAAEQATLGILVDGSGIGMSIAANKVNGIRAALAHDEVAARIARESNHCNVLCVGADLMSESQIRKVVEAFMATEFGDGRHARRVEKLLQLEREERGRANG